MDQNYRLSFNAEYPTIGAFGSYLQAALDEHHLTDVYQVENIIERACHQCQAPNSTGAVVEIHLAWLKTTCLEIIKDLSQAHNRNKFDQAVQALFDSNNPDALSFCASVSRTLRQFRLSGTYEVKDIIAEAYTIGVKNIESGSLIRIPLAWLRVTCLNVIRNFYREQKSSKNPRFDAEPCCTGDVEFSQWLLREDMQAMRLAMEQLSIGDRQLLCARIFKQLSWEELGKTLAAPGEPPVKAGTARQRGSRALQRLRDQFNSIRDTVKLSETELETLFDPVDRRDPVDQDAT